MATISNVEANLKLAYGVVTMVCKCSAQSGLSLPPAIKKLLGSSHRRSMLLDLVRTYTEVRLQEGLQHFNRVALNFETAATPWGPPARKWPVRNGLGIEGIYAEHRDTVLDRPRQSGSEILHDHAKLRRNAKVQTQ